MFRTFASGKSVGGGLCAHDRSIRKIGIRLA